MLLHIFNASHLLECLCYIECETGKYGINCQQKCSAFCYMSGICHHITGSCNGGCKNGWTGEQCLEGTVILIQTNKTNESIINILLISMRFKL